MHDMDSLSLPLIDISPFLSSSPTDQDARAKCAQDILVACSSVGFFYLVGHGIPTSLTDDVLALGREFFLGASAEEKNAIIRQKVGVGCGDGARGWQPLRDNVTMGKRDWQEAVDFYREDGGTQSDGSTPGPPYEILKGKNLWPKTPAELKPTYEEYVEKMLKVGDAVVTAMGAAWGEGSDKTFARHTRQSFWGMRLIGYVPIPAAELVPQEHHDDGISCGEHTDYGCVTLLLTDPTKDALQVRPRDDSNAWINVNPVPGAFVVNIGDMMERWTNGLWRSTPHRVIHRGDNFRVSVPFFYEPDFDAW